jgi:hypothetical protein
MVGPADGRVGPADREKLEITKGGGGGGKQQPRPGGWVEGLKVYVPSPQVLAQLSVTEPVMLLPIRKLGFPVVNAFPV